MPREEFFIMWWKNISRPYTYDIVFHANVVGEIGPRLIFALYVYLRIHRPNL